MNIENDVEDSSAKYKILYEIIFHEYKTEINRSEAIDEKVTKFFTVLNILLTLLIALLTRPIYWESFTHINILLKVVSILSIMFLFYFLASAWLDLFKHLRSRKVTKLELGLNNEFEDIVYDDDKDINFLYFKAYKTYQEAIWENAKISNISYQSLENTWHSIKYGFGSFCLFIFFLFLTLLQGALT